MPGLFEVKRRVPVGLVIEHWQQVKGPSQLSRNRQRKNEDFLVGHREKERQSA